MQKDKLYAMVIGALLASAGSALAADIVTNGGFEVEGGGGALDSQGWTVIVGGATGTASYRDTLTPFAGEFAHHLIAYGGDAMGGTAGILQNTATAIPLSLEPGTIVRLSMKAKGAAGPGGVGFYALRILNGAGAIVANTGLQVFFPNSNYAHFATAPLTVPAFGAAPNDAYYAFTEIVVAAGAFVGSTCEALIDNVVIEGTLVAGGPPCPADFNMDGGIDGGDVEAFFVAWKAGEGAADVNADGGVDGADVETFFVAWEAGGC